jgi:hypothetical protein
VKQSRSCTIFLQVVSAVRCVAFAEQGLELGEDLLDRVEVGTVGGQEEELWRRFCGRLGARLALV